MARGKNYRPWEAGFTLLELLIAMTLLGLLMVVLLGGLKFGARAWERNEAHASATDEVRLAQTLLRRELSGIYPLFLTGDLAKRHVAFDGTGDAVTFLAAPPAVMGGVGWAQITFRRVPQSGHNALVMLARQELALSPAASSDTLVQGLESVAFSYFGKEEAGDTPRWHDHWANAKSLPQLIRVDAKFVQGDARIWPQLIVAPQISVDVGCVYDALTKYCQGRR